jgi:aminoglycoside phosphotransferase (APT) family kinase protein
MMRVEECMTASSLLDQTAPVRVGEELDAARLEPYLRDTLGITSDALGITGGGFAIEQFPGGHSNLTYAIRIGAEEFVLRRPPFGSTVKSAHDMGREYTILSRIHDVYGPAPEPLVYCEDESIIGAKFYLMRRLRGIIFRARKPEGLSLTAGDVRAACRGLMENLADMHAIDWKKAGLDVLRKEGEFVARQVEGWSRRYDGSQTDDIPNVTDVFAWCKQHTPADCDAVLIHNDYKFDNIILDANDFSKVVGVLDWEMATIGDPLFDLGVALGYWVNPDERDEVGTSRCFLTEEPGSMTRSELAGIYAARSGRNVDNLHWYYVFALIKLAVVLQQIYYRYYHGHTNDERFAPMIDSVRALAQQAANAIERGKM